MLAIVYEHPTKKTIVKYYKAQDFGKYGDLRTLGAMKEKGYKIAMRITIPNEYIEKMKRSF